MTDNLEGEVMSRCGGDILGGVDAGVIERSCEAVEDPAGVGSWRVKGAVGVATYPTEAGVLYDRICVRESTTNTVYSLPLAQRGSWESVYCWNFYCHSWEPEGIGAWVMFWVAGMMYARKVT
jgi:hypothetical protein